MHSPLAPPCAAHPPLRPQAHVTQSEVAPQPQRTASDTPASFDISEDRHKGQYALRKLYHESTRPIMVLYTGV